MIEEVEITKALARQLRMPAVDLSRFEPDVKLLRLIPADMAKKHMVLPLRRDGRNLTVAMVDPSDLGLCCRTSSSSPGSTSSRSSPVSSRSGT
jgi:hypothetical protein